MGPSLAVAQGVEAAGVIAAAGAAGAAFVLRSPRARAAAVLVALVLTPVLLVGDLWDTDQMRDLRDRPATLVAAAGAALVAVALLSALFLRRPLLLPVLAVVALPFRIPVEAGGESANLLVPLYAVVAAGCLAFAYERVSGRAPRIAPRERDPGAVELALLVAVVLYALQATYSTDFDKALSNVVFFYVPFALLLRLLAGTEWTPRMVVVCFGAAVALALLFAGVGFFQYATRELLWNPKVIESNRFESYFRVNSLFFDPNIYGRFLALVMLVVAAVVLWGRRSRDVLLAGAVLAVLWAGLVLSFSRSSFVALLAGLVVIAALRFGPRLVAVAGASLAVAAIAAALLVPGLTDLDLGDDRALERQSGGRTELIQDGLAMFGNRPLAGYGSGSFEEEFRERERVSSERANAASHTIPVTIGAEQGIVGLAAYAAVLLAALGVLFTGLRPLSRPGPPSMVLVGRAAVATAFAALVVHTLMYAAFLEDPLTWALIGIGLGLGVSDRASRGSDRRRAASSSPSGTAAPHPR